MLIIALKPLSKLQRFLFQEVDLNVYGIAEWLGKIKPRKKFALRTNSKRPPISVLQNIPITNIYSHDCTHTLPKPTIFLCSNNNSIIRCRNL